MDQEAHTARQGGSAVTLGDQLLALELIQATPDAVRLADPYRVVEAGFAYRTRCADRFGPALACFFLILALEVRGRKEDCGLRSAARCLDLPEILELLDAHTYPPVATAQATCA